MKTRHINGLTIAVSVLLLSACSLFEGVSSGTGSSSGGAAKAQFEEIYAKAEQALKQVTSAGGAWAFTEDTLKEARSLAEKQEFDKATKLAKDAITESEIALQQFESQKNAGPYLF